MATQTDRANTGVLWTIVLVGGFAMIAISSALAAMARATLKELDSERPRNADLVTVAALKQTQTEALAAPPAWQDKAKGTVRVPLDVAKRLVLDELRARPEAASPSPPPGFVMPPADENAMTGAVPGAVPGGAPGAAQGATPGAAEASGPAAGTPPAAPTAAPAPTSPGASPSPAEAPAPAPNPAPAAPAAPGGAAAPASP